MVKIEIDKHLAKIAGTVDKNTITEIYYLLKVKNMIIDLSKVKSIDYEGALFLAELSKKNTLTNINQNIKPLYEFVLQNIKNLNIIEDNRTLLFYAREYIKEIAVSIKENGINFLLFFGEFIYFLLFLITHPWKFRFKETAAVIVKAGANIYIVDMLDISIFRELAPLIAAIVVAGRSASAFSAEMGVMKLTKKTVLTTNQKVTIRRFLRIRIRT